MKYLFLIFIILVIFELEISPRIEIVRGKDVYLFYTWYKQRHNILLFTL